jgi:hypothetical protein
MYEITPKAHANFCVLHRYICYKSLQVAPPLIKKSYTIFFVLHLCYITFCNTRCYIVLHRYFIKCLKINNLVFLRLKYLQHNVTQKKKGVTFCTSILLYYYSIFLINCIKKKGKLKNSVFSLFRGVFRAFGFTCKKVAVLGKNFQHFNSFCPNKSGWRFGKRFLG